MQERALELMERGWKARREDDPVAARQNMQEAISLFRQSDDQDFLVTALGRLGHIEMDQHRWGEAEALYEEAINICRGAGDVLGLAHKTRHLGDVYRHTGRHDEAGACYEEALALYRGHTSPHPLDVANAIRMVALYREKQGDATQAIALWTEAQTLYRQIKIQDGVDEAAVRIADLTG